MAAAVTLFDVAAERGGAALLDGRHHTALRRRQGGPDLGPERIAVTAEDFRHRERGAWHGRRSVDALDGEGDRLREQVQWTLGRADRGGRQLQVAGRRLKASMPEQELNRAQVRAGLEHVEGESVAKSVRENRLGEACPSDGDQAGAVDRA